MFYDKNVELWEKGTRKNIGGGVFVDGDPEKLKDMTVDIQPYSNDEALRDYGYTADCTNIMFCDVGDIRINKTFIKHLDNNYDIKKIIKWDDFYEVILNEF